MRYCSGCSLMQLWLDNVISKKSSTLEMTLRVEEDVVSLDVL